tara:strand:- start:643 stop:840 length:198 start_codon:yes stop_codon:yes gene_type:complete
LPEAFKKLPSDTSLSGLAYWVIQNSLLFLYSTQSALEFLVAMRAFNHLRVNEKVKILLFDFENTR